MILSTQKWCKKTSGIVFLGHLRRGSFSYFLQIFGVAHTFQNFCGSCYNIQSKQGLIQKEKVHIDCEEGAQISIFTNKIAIQWWPNIIMKESKQTNITFIIFSLLCSHYVADLIKKLEMLLMVVPVFLKIKFRQAQISVTKIGIPM